MNVSKSISTQLCDGSTTDFMKSHVLSPDGTSALVISESNYVTNWLLPSNLIHKHLYYPTQSLHENRTNSGDIEREDEQLTFQSATDIGESIYDCVWYPHMSLSYPSSCCYLTTSRDHPIHLWSNNSTTNSNPTIQCSYLGYNHLDELDSAISLAFNLTGDKFYAGYNRMIRSFDLANPGKQSSSLPTSRTKRDSFGQKGLISSLSFNPMHSGLFAAGSYDSGSGVYLYQENMRAAVDHLTGGEEMGITCLKWSVCGNIVWVGGRKNSVISCYDIRFPKAELGRVTRELSSNQRMSFSLDPWGKYLATGTQDGRLKIFDTTSFEEISSTHLSPGQGGANCVNSVSFHPYSALLFVSTGERVFDLKGLVEDEDLESLSNSGGSSRNCGGSEILLCEYSRRDQDPPPPLSLSLCPPLSDGNGSGESREELVR